MIRSLWTLFVLILLSTPAWARSWTWRDLTDFSEGPGSEIHLRQEVSFPEGITLPHGTSFRISEVASLDEIKVTLFRLKRLRCSDSAQKTEMIIVLPEGSPPGGRDPSVGIQLSTECLAEVFVENADLSLVSLFD